MEGEQCYVLGINRVNDFDDILKVFAESFDGDGSTISILHLDKMIPSIIYIPRPSIIPITPLLNNLIQFLFDNLIFIVSIGIIRRPHYPYIALFLKPYSTPTPY